MPVIEAPILIEVDGASLAGIVTRPAGRANGAGVVVLHGGGHHNLPSHRNRWTVDLARDLADQGFVVLRVGYRGVGESSGNNQTFNLANPFVDDGAAIIAAMAKEPGVEQIYIVGSCFGARTALSLVPDHPEVAGLVLASVPIADHEMRAATERSVADFMKRGFGKRGLGGLMMPGRRARYLRILRNKVRSMVGQSGSRGNPTPWVAESVVRGLRTLAGRGGRALIVYGTDDEFYQHFQEAQAGAIGVLTSSPAIEVDATIDGRLHGYPTVAVQHALRARTANWLAARVAR